MTSFQTVYDAFLAKMLDDEWSVWEEEDMQEDWKAILKGALPWFKFPRVSLDTDGDQFVEDLNNEEI
jgi:hypothetical protein